MARLELEASQNQQRNPFDNVSSLQSPTISSRHDDLGLPSFPPTSNVPRKQVPASLDQSVKPPKPVAVEYEDMREDFIQEYNSRNVPEIPKFSPFPRPQKPGPSVPLSDDDEEELLERMRPTILTSNDPELQLGWAQDALAWVETASSFALRQQDGGQPARSITPKVEHQLRIDALSIVTFLGEQQHPKAEFMMGMWLEFGKFGHRVDKKEAFLKYKRAAERGYARAEYRIGMQYEGSNNATKAIEHYQKGVLLRDSASNYRLGMMTLLGQHGVAQNFQRGVELIQYAARGADKNAPQGAYVYGMLLARELPNIDVPDNYLPYNMNDARLYVAKAARLGFAKAQLKMAQAYELCLLGVDFDPTLSLHYNALASRQGEAEADMAISKWFLCGFEKQFEKNEELAFTYAKRAAATKMATAEFAMGYYYEVGVYVKSDLREAESWYKLAAEHGNKDALGRIESIKKNSTFTKKDHEDVALSRIKSQYGSMRGKRPDRFKEKPPPMPSMAEDLDMPDPRKSYSGTTGGERRPTIPQVQLPPVQARPPVINHPLPPRPVSTAPYPVDDIPPPKFIPPRKSITPYPEEDIGAGGLRPSQRPGPQADRPSSAFGIRPLVDVPSYGPPGRGRGNPYLDPRPATSQSNMHVPGRGRGDVRPATSMANIQPPGGRGQAPGGRGQPPGRGQVPEGRGGFTSRVPSSYDTLPSQQRLPAGESRLSQRGSYDLDKPQPAQPMRVGDSRLPQRGPYDLDKPQPANPPGQDYHSGSSGAQRPSSSSGPSQRPSSSHAASGPPASHQQTGSGGQSRPDPGNQFIRPDRGSSVVSANSQAPNPRPQRLDSAQSSVSAASGSRVSNRPLPSQTTSSQAHDMRPSVAAPSSAPSMSSASTGPKKSSGADTFDEMGIPPAKPEKECVSLSVHLSLISVLITGRL